MPNKFNRRYEKYLIEAENFNLTEVAYYLQVSHKTVHNYVNRYGLPKHYGRGTGRDAYYVKKEVDEWVRKNPRFILR